MCGAKKGRVSIPNANPGPPLGTDVAYQPWWYTMVIPRGLFGGATLTRKGMDPDGRLHIKWALGLSIPDTDKHPRLKVVRPCERVLQWIGEQLEEKT